MSERLSFSARFRAGSNFPTTGYWTERDVRVSRRRGSNTLERARLRAPGRPRQSHVRVERQAADAVPRGDQRAGRDGTCAMRCRRSTGERSEATGLYERMVPRIPSVGVLLEF